MPQKPTQDVHGCSPLMHTPMQLFVFIYQLRAAPRTCIPVRGLAWVPSSCAVSPVLVLHVPPRVRVDFVADALQAQRHGFAHTDQRPQPRRGRGADHPNQDAGTAHAARLPRERALRAPDHLVVRFVHRPQQRVLGVQEPVVRVEGLAGEMGPLALRMFSASRPTSWVSPLCATSRAV